MEPIVCVNNHHLHAVPAVHYRAVFAREVHRICSSAQSRPDAIAVELGNPLVQAIVHWMKELGIGPGKRVMLPCMLGVLYNNDLIHPRFRDTAYFLQEFFGRPLREIPAELLRKMLYFHGRQMVCLSATDSIIEAIRCGVELDVPVYGVDMENFASYADSVCMVGDPSGPAFELEDYISRFRDSAARQRDPWVDGRREQVMAARLKSVLETHRRVLFTCGLAHWNELVRLLQDSYVRPAEIVTATTQEFTRVTVHPLLAIRSMDLFPEITTRYERLRNNAGSGPDPMKRIPGMADIARKILDRTYQDAFQNRVKRVQWQKVTDDIAGMVPAYERFMESLQLLQNRSTPGMDTLMEAATGMMPPAFCSLLSYHLMKLGRKWSSPLQFPDLPLLGPASRNEEADGNHRAGGKVQLVKRNPKSFLNEKEWDSSAPFYFRMAHGSGAGGCMEKYWNWEDEPMESSKNSAHMQWVWPPCESLLYGTAGKAASLAVTNALERRPVVFEGSIYGGPDMKATIRARTSGENRVYVKQQVKTRRMVAPDGKHPEPTVFIFASDSETCCSHWAPAMAGSTLAKFVKDKNKYLEATRDKGNTFIASISFCHDRKVPHRQLPSMAYVDYLDGITVFGNPCLNARQGAMWVEENDFTCCPVISGSDMGTILKFYERFHGMVIDLNAWQTALVWFAIPYARERVVVIAPPGFVIPAGLHAVARRRGISLDTLQLGLFPSVKIEEMRNRIFVRTADPDGLLFPPEIESALKQTPDTYVDLLPEYMQQQLRRP